MKKSLFFLLFFLIPILMLSSCNLLRSEKDILYDAEKMTEVETLIKQRTEGKKILFRVVINSYGDIHLSQQREEELETIQFIRKYNEWRIPSSIHLKPFIDKNIFTADELSACCWSIDSFDFKVIQKTITDAETLAKKENISNIKMMSIELSNQTIFIDMKSDRGILTYEANSDGSFRKFNL